MREVTIKVGIYLSMGSMTTDRDRGISAETAGFRRHFSGVHIGVHRLGFGVDIVVCLKRGKCFIKSRFRLVRWE